MCIIRTLGVNMFSISFFVVDLDVTLTRFVYVYIIRLRDIQMTNCSKEILPIYIPASVITIARKFCCRSKLYLAMRKHHVIVADRRKIQVE